MKQIMIKAIVTVLLGSALISYELHAQQDPMYSQYMFNMSSINPAYAGVREMLTMTALYRQQWVGMEGAPTTLTLSLDAPIKKQKMALGVNIVSDKIGIAEDLMINALYAYRVYFANRGVLSLGLQAGVNQRSADYASVATATYYGGSADDPAFASSLRGFFPNFGFGAYYYSQRFFAGVGVPRMLKNNLRGDNQPTLDFTSFANRQTRHMFVSAGYSFDLNQDWSAKPSVMIKGVRGAPIEGDINCNLWWKNTLGGGLSYRTADAVIAMIEFKPRKEIHIGYAYDYTVSGLAGTNAGSHEIMLRYEPHAAKVKSSQYQSRRFGNNKMSMRKKQKLQIKKRKAYQRKAAKQR